MATTPAGPLLAREFMVTNLITLTEDLDALTAIRTLLRHKISGAPVVDQEGNFLGVFSERNSINFLVGLTYEQLPSTHVGAFMNTDRGCTIGEDTDIYTIAHLFLEKEYRRLPVLRGTKVAGQVSRRDLLNAVLRRIDEHELDSQASLLYLSALIDRNQAPFSSRKK